MSVEEYFASDSTGNSIRTMKDNISNADKSLSDLLRISSYIISNIREKQFMEGAASIGLSDNQFYILKILSNKSPFTLSNLAKTLLISNAAVGKMTDKLVHFKLVTRRFRKKDRRTAMVSITHKGQEIVEYYNNLIIEKQTENIKQFSTIDKEKFTNYIKLFIRSCLHEEMDTNILCYQCHGFYGDDCVIEEIKGYCIRKNNRK
ncbi:MAG: MarR family transcriptional regulator [Candidatus Marinimicrobia bacterium]|nr:MarR family transcriptional regulator [Candidatus Neomarinimicrobiota bacterium]